MYAVIEAAGRQYRVELGETVKMEKIASEPGTPIVFDKVLVVTTDAGTQIGKPYVLDAKVSGTILRTTRDRKIRVFTYKNKTCLLYTSPSPRDRTRSRMPSSA